MSPAEVCKDNHLIYIVNEGEKFIIVYGENKIAICGTRQGFALYGETNEKKIERSDFSSDGPNKSILVNGVLIRSKEETEN